MTKTAKGIITVIVVGGLAYGIYHFGLHHKRQYAKIITQLGGASTYITLLTMDEPYLKAWSKALKRGDKQFTYNGVAYNTQGGTKIKT